MISINFEKQRKLKETLLVDPLQNIQNHVVRKLRISIPKLSESSLKHTQRLDLPSIHVIVYLL